MPDRRRRTDLLLPRERQSTDDNNPFAPPPEGKPDQPWQPRQPSNGSSDQSGSGSGSGSGSDSGSGSSDGSSDDRGGRGGWGSQWSSRQPGRSSGGGFGGRPGPNAPNGGQQGPGGTPPGPRWDPTDPTQRRARYALLSGMWAFFFAVFDFTEIALLLGALALYWSISSLRGKAGDGRKGAADATAAPAPAPTGAAGAAGPGRLSNRSQRTAAITGLVMGGIALAIVAAAFTAQLVYRDFYTCERDALTKDAQLSCNEKLPEPLRDLIGVTE
ncbi:hypothetical protein [Streptomyces sp. NPDC014894]|uniref:hypothetical protein n=1 Tax=unclassified Streptomyces TaxID=2593676 RepID=UPI0036F606A6